MCVQIKNNFGFSYVEKGSFGGLQHENVRDGVELVRSRLRLRLRGLRQRCLVLELGRWEDVVGGGGGGGRRGGGDEAAVGRREVPAAQMRGRGMQKVRRVWRTKKEILNCYYVHSSGICSSQGDKSTYQP